MDDDIKVSKVSILLFIIFAVLIVIVFLVFNNSLTTYRPHVGRYTTSAPVSGSSQDILDEYGIKVNGNIQYELILKNDDTFVLYVTGINNTAYTGNYDKGINKYTLKAYRTYNIDKKCYSKKMNEFKLKQNNKSLITEELSGKELTFIKYDENINKYDDTLDMIYLECGTINDY